MVSLEHESNGKAGEDSRSWNYLNLSAKYFYNMRLSAKAQVYLPYVDGGNNKDLLRYKGYGIFSVNYIDSKNLWWFSLNIIPRDQFINPNLRDDLIKKIYDSLVPGGILVLSEKFAFTDPKIKDTLYDLHLDFKRANGYSELEISQKRSSIENVLIPETVDAHRARLHKAGFKSVELWYQCFNFGSLLAIK